MSTAIIVEADDGRRDALVSLSRRLGLGAILATADGQFALQLLRSGAPPDLVLLGTQSTKTDVLAAIRADPQLSTIRVVAMSCEPHELALFLSERMEVA